VDNSQVPGQESCQDGSMIQRLKPKSEFTRNVLTLMTGTTIAQAIPIAISPILTRIYTPEDFGLLALFGAVTSIFGGIANGRYELAIILPKKDEDAINIFALGFIITCVVSFLLLIAVVLFSDYFTTLLRNEEIRLWLYFAPLVVFLTGLFNLLNYFNIRKKNYKDLASAAIIRAAVGVIIQLSVGFVKQGVTGLISGQIISQFFANTKLLKNIIKDKNFFLKISKVKIIALAKIYKDFPKYSTFATLINTLSHKLPNILISAFYTINTLGFYALVQRVLRIPSALIGTSIAQVFLQQATIEKQQTGKTIITFSNTVKKLIIIGLPFFTILFFTVEDLFAFIFSEEWRIAGIYAKIVIPWFFVSFVVSTVSGIDTVMEKNKKYLMFNFLMLIITILVLYISKELAFEKLLLNFTIAMSATYIMYGYTLYKTAKNEFNFVKKNG
jgi:O-antigen/teichoic acid export membrane protein